MKLILNGGGVGDSAAAARQLLNQAIDHSKKVLYIPFAWPDPAYRGCLEFMTGELCDVDKAGIDMVRTPGGLTRRDFADYACLYIGGGNTFRLLQILKTSGAFGQIRRYLLEDDGIVYGGSAGAVIFGKDLDACRPDDENEAGLTDHTGFDLLHGHSLLCHYTSRDAERTRKARRYLLELSKIKPVCAIPEEDTIYVENESITFIGNRPYYVFTGGTVTERTCLSRTANERRMET